MTLRIVQYSKGYGSHSPALASISLKVLASPLALKTGVELFLRLCFRQLPVFIALGEAKAVFV